LAEHVLEVLRQAEDHREHGEEVDPDRGHADRHPAAAEEREVEHRPPPCRSRPGEGDRQDG
jgi:hypothetical protein